MSHFAPVTEVFKGSSDMNQKRISTAFMDDTLNRERVVKY